MVNSQHCPIGRLSFHEPEETSARHPAGQFWGNEHSFEQAL